MYKYLILLIISLSFWGGAQAQTLAADNLLVGGVGIESEAQLRAREKDFNTKFVFTAREGDWVADVALKVISANGAALIDQTIAAPILLARLPAGRYTAKMTYQGQMQTRKFRVGNNLAKSLQTIHAGWKRSATDGPSMLR
jgi:hypothetical protein